MTWTCKISGSPDDRTVLAEYSSADGDWPSVVACAIEMIQGAVGSNETKAVALAEIVWQRLEHEVEGSDLVPGIYDDDNKSRLLAASEVFYDAARKLVSLHRMFVNKRINESAGRAGEP